MLPESPSYMAMNKFGFDQQILLMTVTSPARLPSPTLYRALSYTLFPLIQAL